MNEEKTKKKFRLSQMSEKTKWIITLALAALAVLTVVLCALGGNFNFKPGSVQARDVEATPTVTPKADDSEKEEGVTHKIVVTAGNGGSADQSGSITVEDWGSLTVNFTPDEGYELESVTVDGENKGKESSYTLSYIKEDHTIIATFKLKPKPTPTPTPSASGDLDLSGLEHLFDD